MNLQNISFRRDGMELNNNTLLSVSVSETTSATSSLVTAVLQIFSVTQETSGEYECFVSNSISNDSSTFTINLLNETGIALLATADVPMTASLPVVWDN